MLRRWLCKVMGHDWRFYYRKDADILSVWGNCTRCDAWERA
jgi:hypothetical protein